MENQKDQHALIHLKSDIILRPVIERIQLPLLTAQTNTYIDVLESIISQQLSVKASTTIYNRFIALFQQPLPSPSDILTKPDIDLRSAGLSYQKIKYIKSFAQAIHSKSLNLQDLPAMPDENVIIELTKVKGIGRWTAEMILIFSLRRPDVFSLNDLGLRTAVAKIYNINREDLKSIEEISKKWSPYRSLASRYLWKSLDNMPKQDKKLI